MSHRSRMFWQDGCIESTIRRVAPYISVRTKRQIISSLGQALSYSVTMSTGSQSHTSPEIRMSRFQAQDATRSRDTLFGQMYVQMHGFGPEVLRSDFATERAWSVTLDGEGGIDAGGPFREILRLTASELQSVPKGPTGQDLRPLKMLIPCPNATNTLGDNRDRWILNPAFPAASQGMLIFFGRLMGHALQTGNSLELNLAPIFWNQ
eukprot:912369-Amorphochlora_amoeboformis.AAC.1